MTDERIVISVEDRIKSSVPRKFRDIATNSRSAATNVQMLNTALRQMRVPTGLNAINSQLSLLSRNLGGLNTSGASAALILARLQSAMNSAALTAARLATEQQRTAIAAARLATEQQRTARATSDAASAAARAAIAQANAANAQAMAAARLTAAQARATTAQNNAALSALRLSQAQREARQSTNALSGSLSRLQAGFASLGASVSAVGAIRLADQYTGFNNRVGLVTDSVEAQSAAMQRLKEISQESYADMQTSVTLFARLDRSMNLMGKSQSETLRITETLNKAIAVGGLNAGEASAALLQLSQALNAGRLNGDEFRSVSENMPIALDAMAEVMSKKLNISIAAATMQLKSMSQEGQLTSDVMIEAFELMASDVDAAFEKVTPRIGMSFNNLRTEATMFFGEMDQGLGVTRAISDAIALVVDNLHVVVGFATTAAAAVAAMTASMILARVAAMGLTRALLMSGLGAIFVAVGLVASKFFELTQQLGSAGAAFAAMSNIASEVAQRVVAIGKSIAQMLGAIVGLIAVDLMNRINTLNRVVLFVSGTVQAVVANMGIAVYNGIVSILNSAITALNDMVNGVIDTINSMIERINAALNTSISTLSNVEKQFELDPTEFVDLPKWETTLGGLEGAMKVTATATKELFKDSIETAKEAINTPLESVAELNAALDEAAKNRAAQDEANLAALRAADEAQAKLYKDEADRLANQGKDKKDAANKQKESLESILNAMRDEMDMLQMLERERGIANQVLEAQKKLKKDGVELTEEEFDLLTKTVKLLERERELAQARDQIMQDTVYKRQEELDLVRAIQQLQSQGAIGAGDAASTIMGSSVGDFFAGTSVETESRVQQYADYYAQIDALRAADLVSEQDYSAAKMAIWAQEQKAKTDQYANFFGGIAELAQSGNERLAAIGKAAAIAQTMIQTYQSATSAYAAMAGIPVVGPGLGAAAAAAAVAAGLANVAQIRAQGTGFKTGGYTGGMGVNDVAGFVHGQEYVMTAATTSRVGVSDLEALQRGTASVVPNSDMGYSEPQGQSSAPANVNVIVVASKEEAESQAQNLGGETHIVDTVLKNSKTIKKGLGIR